MRILMVTDFYPPFVGGVEVLVSTLSRELVTRGHDVAVATLGTADLPQEDVDEGVRVHRLPATSGRAGFLFTSERRPWAPPVPDPEATVALRRVLGREAPDIVHGHDWLARSFLPLKRRGGPRLVTSLHYFTRSCPKKNLMRAGRPCPGPSLGACLSCAGDHYGRAKGTAVTLGNRAAARAETRLTDLFIPVSGATAIGNGLVDAEPPLPHVVIPNLVPPAQDSSAHAELLAALPEEPFLLFVGDLRGDKGIDVLLAAYERLDDPPPLALIGKVWPESPTTLPRSAHLFRDWPNAAVRAAMARSLALVVPSVWQEPFGIVVAESLSAGRPVVASDIGGIPEIVRDGSEGLLVPPGDVDALRAALDRITRDGALRERLASAASARAGDFTADAIVPQFEAAYASVLSGGAPPSSARG